jgi:hypothetical protein
MCNGIGISFEHIYGPGMMNPSSDIQYIWTADLADIGSTLGVRVLARDSVSSWEEFCDFNLYVYPFCGDFNNDRDINILDVVAMISYLYQSGDDPYFYYYADVDSSGNIDILDITGLIGYLYQSGTLECKYLKKDDYPVIRDNWWKYERFDSLTNTYDTVTVEVNDYNSLKYITDGGENYKTVSFDNCRAETEGYYPDIVYEFPLAEGKAWDGKVYFLPSRDSVVSFAGVIVPAGHFYDGYYIKRTWGCGDECVAEMWEFFKPGLGTALIEFRENDFMDGVVTTEIWRLLEYSIAPRE